MTYVMSDIHGDMNRFLRMLDEIDFSPRDRLYVLGDVIDRGEYGIDILRYAMEHENMTCLLGNHEYMCLSCVRHKILGNMPRVWLANGGEPTLAVLEALAPEWQARILDYMAAMSEELEIQVNGKKFRLVHGCPGGTQYERLWCSPDVLSFRPEAGVISIVGHLPTFKFRLDGMTARLPSGHMEIFHGPGFIGIDCGCGVRRLGMTPCLGCLRLDDMREFYVV